ncbi:hypothetical protein GCM10010520_63380 [Rhizobium viscosum]|uniref:Calcium-binding protein n=1 Tax=Rhizobium viscosum TaxID=1673 RepID=A0ABR9IUT2_RHIVS|nr:calcium-binding protein [Rhizobium viscosum]MBE1506974.1 hypothetical protein [Rhizobium viscosum]
MTVTNSIMSSIYQSSTYRFSKTTIEEWRAAKSGGEGGDDRQAAPSSPAPDKSGEKDGASATSIVRHVRQQAMEMSLRVLVGTGGDDRLHGGSNSFVDADAGNDEVSAYSDATVDGGDGGDYISTYDHATVSGGRGDDVIDTYDYSIIDGGDGNDEIWTYAHSTVDGGAGDDIINGYGDSDITGGAGNDHVSVNDHSKVNAGAGNDWVSGYDYSTVDGGDGNDYISVYRDSTVNGGAGNDVIETYERSVITGGKGADRIQTGGGSILKYAAGDGRDQIMVSGSATLELGEGISADAVQVTVNGRTATISVNGNSDDVITVELYAGASSSLTIAFADGSTRQVTAQPASGGGTPHLPPNSQVPILLPPGEPAMSKEAFEAMIRDPNMSQAQREYLVGSLAPAIYGIPRYDYSHLEWHTLPPGSAQPMSAEVKAQLAASQELARQLQAERDAETAAHPERYNPQTESNDMYETNVATLPDDAIKPRIEYISHLIQSGEADKYSFHAGNGDQTTNSIHQFLFWLQQRAQEMESDGTYSPGMFG